jgi:hypothetical protein
MSIAKSNHLSAADKRLLANMISLLTARENEKQEIAPRIRSEIESAKQSKSFRDRIACFFLQNTILKGRISKLLALQIQILLRSADIFGKYILKLLLRIVIEYYHL